MTMTSKLTIGSNIALVFVLLGMGAHILGFVTDYWCQGYRDKGLSIDSTIIGVATDNLTDSDVLFVHTGLFRQKLEFENDALMEEDSSMALLEEQILVLAIAGTNTLLCLILYIRAIHIFVGVSSFIVMSLMLLAAFYTFEHTKEEVDKLQDYHSNWPEINLSWSFICVFCGLVVNIISTATFLTVLLLKGERKASNSSRGLGPAPQVDHDKTPMISVISGDQSYENTAYAKENKHYSSIEIINSDNEFVNTGAFAATNDIDVDIESERTRKNFQTANSSNKTTEYAELYPRDSKVPEGPYTDLDAPDQSNFFTNRTNDNYENIEPIIESCHL